MGKKDVFLFAVGGAMHTLLNVAMMATLFGLPFGAVDRFSSLDFMFALIPMCVAATLGPLIAIAVGLSSHITCVVCLILDLVVIAMHIAVIVVHSITFASCKTHGICNPALNWDGSQAVPPKPFPGMRTEFLVYYIMLFAIFILELCLLSMSWSAGRTCRRWEEMQENRYDIPPQAQSAMTTSAMKRMHKRSSAGGDPRIDPELDISAATASSRRGKLFGSYRRMRDGGGDDGGEAIDGAIGGGEESFATPAPASARRQLPFGGKRLSKQPGRTKEAAKEPSDAELIRNGGMASLS
jgi:hypothetical protein